MQKKRIFFLVVTLFTLVCSEKIELDTKKPMYIQVVWGVGYKLKKG